MPKNNSSHIRPKKVPSSDPVLFPFLHHQMNHRFAGAVFAGLYGIILLVIGLTYHVIGDYHVETDFFQVYVPTAKEMLHGIWTIEDFRGPAYPAVLALCSLLIPNFFTAGIVVSVLTASFTLFFTFESIKKLFRADVALTVVLLTAFNKTFVQYSYTAGTDMTFNCFTAAAVYFLLKHEKRSWLNLSLSALFAAFAYLTRYNGVSAVFAVPLVIVVFNIYSVDLKQRVITAAVFVALFFNFIAPWGIHSFAEKGSFFYNKNYLNIAYEMFAKGRIGWDQYWNVESAKYGSLAQVIFADPGLFVSTVLKNLYEHLINDMELLVHWGIGIGCLAGLIGMVQHRPNNRQAAYYVFGGMIFLILLLVFYGERFSMYLIPVYSTLAVGALVWHRWQKIPLYNATVVALVLIGWTAVVSYDYNKVNIDSGPKEIKVIADWFNANIKDTDESKIIVCRKPHIAFYINKTMKYFPYVESWEELERETKKINASYFFYGIFEANMRPQFQQLLNPRTAPPWLEPITYTVNPPSVLYRVKYDR